MRTYDRIPERTYAYLWRTYGVPMCTYVYLCVPMVDRAADPGIPGLTLKS